MRRVLLVNVDDIGIYPQAVEPAIDAIADGIAASGSVMTVCSGSDHALAVLAARPDICVGVHLTLTRDLASWQWAPLTSGASIQRGGLLAPIEQRDHLLAQARIDDVEAEFRAQIEKALDADVRPTHVDWQCLADGGREDIFDATLHLADEYQIGIRAWTDHGRGQLCARGRVTQDQPFLDSFSVPVDGKLEFLLDLVRHLRAGLTEWAVHPAGYKPDDPGAAVRYSDREALLSPVLRQVLADEKITVIGHRNGHETGQSE